MHADTSLPVHAQVQVASYVIRGCVPQLDVTFAVMFIFGHGFTTTLGPPSTLEAVCNGRKSESYNTRAVQRDTQRWPLVGSICKNRLVGMQRGPLNKAVPPEPCNGTPTDGPGGEYGQRKLAGIEEVTLLTRSPTRAVQRDTQRWPWWVTVAKIVGRLTVPQECCSNGSQRCT